MCDTDKTIYDPGATQADSATTILDGAKLSVSADPCYEQGDSILNTYRVESKAIESGGMGRVWRVYHTGWNVDLAMKRPRAEHFADEKSKLDFIRECDTWIKLGLHPNIVSCYYVRLIDGIPTIFSEWMDGGSLQQAIKSRALYRGTPAEQQERILDIAIQFARGLHFAHEAGLIHQDVKPDNLLLTAAGDAKVADFGLAKARAVLTVRESGLPSQAKEDSSKTIVSPSGGYTPAYCSMEQMDGKVLTRRTDIYSWAVSVLEMYCGKRDWANGVVAGLRCQRYFNDARIPIPKQLQQLLTQCLKPSPDERPHDFSEIALKLREIFKSETGTGYPRPAPIAVAEMADSLNNRALSMLDLNRLDEARNCWASALRDDSFHTESVYNLNMWRCVIGEIDIRAAIQQINVCHQNLRTWRSSYYLGKAYLQLPQPESALSFFRTAIELGGPEDSISREIGIAEKMLSRGIESGCTEQSTRFVSPEWALCRIKNLREIMALQETERIHAEKAKTAIFVRSDYDEGIKEIKILRSIPGFERSSNYTALCYELSKFAKPVSIRTAWKPEDCFFKNIMPKNRVLSLAIDFQCSSLCTTEIDGNTTIWSTVTSDKKIIERQHGPVHASKFCDLKEILITGDESGVKLWNAKTGAFTASLQAHGAISEGDAPKGISSVSCTPNGSFILSGGFDHTVRIWDFEQYICVHVLKGHTDTVTAVDASPDCRHCASGSRDGTVKIWDTQTGECLKTIASHLGGVTCIEYCSDGNYLATGGEDHTVAVWRLSDGSRVHLFEGHTDRVTCMSFSYGGRFLCTGSADQTVRVWDIETGCCLFVYAGELAAVTSVLFSPNQRFLYIADVSPNLITLRFDWEYEFPGFCDWHESARPYLENFANCLRHVTMESDLRDQCFEWFYVLYFRDCGRGWIRKEGVRAKLAIMEP